ncbi:MAG: FHA domain-containing protein [Mycobacterium sp.]|nr:MAG: FHA domain-containing protein [Mycobacterium sp.]
MNHQKDDQATRAGTANTTAALSSLELLGKTDTSAAVESDDWGADPPPGVSAVLVVKRGPNAGSRFRLDKAVTTAGRHPDSDIYLDDITVSRRHAEFRAENGDYRVVDTSSLNGTYVNRKSVESAVLTHGDEIQIGKSCLVFLTNSRTDPQRGAS